jgi:predicted Zn-dependent protease
MLKTKTLFKLGLFAVLAMAVTLWLSCEAAKKLGGPMAEKTVGSENVKLGKGVYELGKAALEVINALEGMSIEDERAMGETVTLQAYATPNFGVPVRDKEVMMFMNRMANVIGQHSERPMIPYHAAVIKSDELNAFSAPGGYIFVTSGLLLQLEDEAELAMVIGHEVAHIAQKHAVKALKDNKLFESLIKLLQSGQKLTQSTFSQEQNFGQYESLVNSLAKNVVGHAYDQDTEIISDKAGAGYAMATGYDPRAILALLDRLKTGKEGSTHPTAEARSTAMKEWLNGDKEKTDEQKAVNMDDLVRKTDRFAALKARIQAFDEKAWND